MLRILEENIMYQSFKGGLGGIALSKHGRSRAINAENPHGEKGKGGMQRAIWTVQKRKSLPERY